MNDLIKKLIRSIEVMDRFTESDLKSIRNYDEYYEDLNFDYVDICLDIKVKPDFNRIEEMFKINMHSELVEYMSKIWCPAFRVVNKKSIIPNHSNDEIYVRFLSSPEHLDMLIEDIEMYTKEMNNVGVEGVFIPIASKDDGWNILFNNLDGCIYIQEHDPCGAIKVAESIQEFYFND